MWQYIFYLLNVVNWWLIGIIYWYFMAMPKLFYMFLNLFCKLNIRCMPGTITNARSPTTSNNLCLAGSLGNLNVRLLSIPASLTSTSFLLNILDMRCTWSSSTGLSTTTIALFISPPFIRSWAKSCSSS